MVGTKADFGTRLAFSTRTTVSNRQFTNNFFCYSSVQNRPITVFLEPRFISIKGRSLLFDITTRDTGIFLSAFERTTYFDGRPLSHRVSVWRRVGTHRRKILDIFSWQTQRHCAQTMLNFKRFKNAVIFFFSLCLNGKHAQESRTLETHFVPNKNRTNIII